MRGDPKPGTAAVAVRFALVSHGFPASRYPKADLTALGRFRAHASIEGQDGLRVKPLLDRLQTPLSGRAETGESSDDPGIDRAARARWDESMSPRPNESKSDGPARDAREQVGGSTPPAEPVEARDAMSGS